MRSKGFTLVEIVVTVAILTVLLAVGVPGLMSYFDDTNEKKILNDANTVLNVAKTYNESNKASLAGHHGLDNYTVTYQKDEESQKYLTDLREKADVSGVIYKIQYDDRKVTALIYQLNGEYAIYHYETNDFEITDHIPQGV